MKIRNSNLKVKKGKIQVEIFKIKVRNYNFKVRMWEKIFHNVSRMRFRKHLVIFIYYYIRKIVLKRKILRTCMSFTVNLEQYLTLNPILDTTAY